MTAPGPATFGHDHEPVRGLPAPLPDGESILWQGAPNWRSLARRVMRIRLCTTYFLLLAVWDVAGGLNDGTHLRDIGASLLRLGALGLVAIGVLTLFAWLAARSTVYTVTTRRVVVRFGIALPITLQIAYAMIDAAGLHLWPNGDGDIALGVRDGGQKVSYLIVWPHVRPWRFARPEATLRCIPDAAAVAQILGRALAASASQAAQPMPLAAGTATAGAHVPAAA